MPEHRAAAPDGDAELVQELRVDIVDRALQVGLDGPVEVGQDQTEALEGIGVRIERRGRVTVEAGRVDTGCGHRRRHDVVVDLGHPRGAHDLDELRGLLLVSGEFVDLDEPPFQRALFGGHRLVDGRRGDDLAVAVAAHGSARPGRDAQLREQGADLDDLAEAGPERAGGQVGGDPGRPGDRQVRVHGTVAAQHEYAVPDLEAQPGAVHQPVERVQHRPSRHRRRADVEPCRSQRGNERLGIGHVASAGDHVPHSVSSG